MNELDLQASLLIFSRKKNEINEYFSYVYENDMTKDEN